MGIQSPHLQFRVLGSLRISHNDEEVELNPPMQRRLLLRLLIDANTVISKDRIQEALWPGSDEDKSNALRYHVAKLRDAVDPERSDLISTQGTGYQLSVSDDQIDANVFAEMVDRAGRMIESDPGEARAVLDVALQIWAGSPYSDAEFDDFARSEIIRLDEVHLRAIEFRMQALLETGRHEEAVAELEALVQQHPLRERLRGLQMLALFRSGRQAEALRAYTAAKATLGEELGIEPSEELAALEEKILFGEDELLRAPVRATATVNTAPLPAGPLIGREEDLTDIRRLAGSSRVVTLTGVGGVGKTRLAQAYATEHEQGYEAVWWINMAAVTSNEDVVGVVADAIGAEITPDASPIAAITDRLGPSRGLLVVDNCEQVAEGVASAVSEILGTSPRITLLVTSRRPLQLKNEAIHKVPGLETPTDGDDDETIGESEAVAFFLSSADRHGRLIQATEMEAVASIVRRLEGIPLAIEFAVARLSALTPNQLNDRLKEDMDTLGSAGPDELEHRRTMPVTIKWSVDLLSTEGRILFERFGVFRGGADLEAIEAVCSDGLLDSTLIVGVLEELVDASLLEQRHGPTGSRFVMLESVAAVAQDALAHSERGERILAVHAGYFADLSVSGHEGLIDIDQAEYLVRFGEEEANLRLALVWGQENDPELAIRVASGLGRYWSRTGSHVEARQEISTLLDVKGIMPSPALANVLGTLAYVDLLSGEADESRKLIERQAAVAEESGAFTSLVRANFTESSLMWAEGETFSSVERLSAALEDLGPRSDPLAVYMLRELGRRRIQLGIWDKSQRVVSELRWWSDRGHPAARAALSELEGALSFYFGDVEEADRQLSASIVELRELGAQHELAEVLNMASNVALARGDWDRSTKYAIEAGDLARETLALGAESQALAILGNALLRSGRSDIARRNLVLAIEMAQAAPAMVELVWAVSFLAAYKSLADAPEGAVVLYSAAEQSSLEMGLAVPANLEAYRHADLERLEGLLGGERYAELRAFGHALGPGQDLLDFVSS